MNGLGRHVNGTLRTTFSVLKPRRSIEIPVESVVRHFGKFLLTTYTPKHSNLRVVSIVQI